jgi:hypothetical protein
VDGGCKVRVKADLAVAVRVFELVMEQLSLPEPTAGAVMALWHQIKGLLGVH